MTNTAAQDDLFGGFDNTVKDRVLQVKRNGSWRFVHHIDVNTHRPVVVRGEPWERRQSALRLTARMAETIRFNLGARGFTVRVIPVE